MVICFFKAYFLFLIKNNNRSFFDTAFKCAFWILRQFFVIF